MCVMNDLDRFHLVGDVIARAAGFGPRAAYAKQAIRDKLIEDKELIARYGDDTPEISEWTWGRPLATEAVQSTEADNV
jgi:xylulose-5-phosphate/fructose-6-phosphate phosphoketolase